MKKFEILSQEKVVDVPFCRIEKHVVRFPNGTTGDWYVNLSHDAVIVIPVTSSGEIVLQKAYKHGCRDILVEFCAGVIDEGETPESSAVRELEEETGYKAEAFHCIGNVLANPSGSQKRFHYFYAENATPTSSQELEEAEQIEPFLVENLEKAKALLADPSTNASVSAVTGLLLLEEFYKGRS